MAANIMQPAMKITVIHIAMFTVNTRRNPRLMSMNMSLIEGLLPKKACPDNETFPAALNVCQMIKKNAKVTIKAIADNSTDDPKKMPATPIKTVDPSKYAVMNEIAGMPKIIARVI